MQIEGDPRPSKSVDNIILELKILHILLFWVLLYFSVQFYLEIQPFRLWIAVNAVFFLSSLGNNS